MSGEQVVDHEMQLDPSTTPKTARSTTEQCHLISPAHPRLVDPRATTHYVLDNLGEWAEGRQPRCIVEAVTHSTAGDPAFWASRMAPPQTPNLKPSHAIFQTRSIGIRRTTAPMSALQNLQGGRAEDRFWDWMEPSLVENWLRGVVGEFLVASSLGLTHVTPGWLVELGP